MATASSLRYHQNRFLNVMVKPQDSEELSQAELKKVQGAGFGGTVCPSFTEKKSKKRILTDEKEINIKKKKPNSVSRLS